MALARLVCVIHDRRIGPPVPVNQATRGLSIIFVVLLAITICGHAQQAAADPRVADLVQAGKLRVPGPLPAIGSLSG